MNLKEDFQVLEIKNQELLAVEEKCDQLQTEVRGLSGGITKRIFAGETTGDPVKDATLIGAYGRPNQKFEDTYRLVQSKLVGKRGQIAATIRREECFYGCSGFGHTPTADEYFLEEHLTAGILTAEALVLDPAKGICDLPVERVASCWRLGNKDFSLGDGAIRLGLGFPLQLNQPLERKNRMGGIPHGSNSQLELMIGDEEVRQWFLAVGMRLDGLYEEIAQSLGQLILRP